MILIGPFEAMSQEHSRAGLDYSRASVLAELRSIAGSYMRREQIGHSLSPTALVNEALLRFLQRHSLADADRPHFLALAARLMRQILVDHARRRLARRRGRSMMRITLTEEIATDSPRTLEVLALDEAMDELSKIDERMARVVELRFFGGLTEREAAETLGVSVATVEGDWRMARAWLRGRMDPGAAHEE